MSGARKGEKGKDRSQFPKTHAYAMQSHSSDPRIIPPSRSPVSSSCTCSILSLMPMASAAFVCTQLAETRASVIILFSIDSTTCFMLPSVDVLLAGVEYGEVLPRDVFSPCKDDRPVPRYSPAPSRSRDNHA